ncbi:ATP-binding protein [Candidatus Oleimmundimicrobium sp.]|uniref:HAMP domain-containing sensor histidine kinase n=1 Tax=Candidatus Oleimmundimicrobium sp. TaxID=3060597 RepID=UPI0027271562|nr:ATP-binding protein [Candidatus Oleimmundimicrobium sp.]MDO8886873.1 ATP-binding protein [Candidatus Oleimmundimicrobium sp.]
MFRSFKTKLIIRYALILVFILALFSGIVYSYAGQQTYSRIDRTLLSRLERIENSESLHFKKLRGVGIKGAGSGQLFFEEILGSQGEVVFANVILEENLIVIDKNILTQVKNKPLIVSGTLTDNSAVRIGIKRVNDNYFVCALPLYESEQNMLSLGMSLLAGNIIFIIIAIVSGLFFVNRALRPIKIITEKADEISSGDLSQRVNLTGPEDELKKLADTLDKMIEKLDNLFKGQKSFFTDISHELKTPLTIARGEIDVALRNPKSTKTELKSALKSAQEELKKMSSMVNDLLSLARKESYKDKLSIKKISVKKFLNEIAKKSGTIVKSKGTKLKVEDFKDFTFKGDAKKLQRLMLSLIDNAVKHISKKGEIVLKAEQKSGFAILSISDNGVGIPAEDIPFIFERFYRGDKSKDASGGTGFGLTIAKKIAEAHGGKIEVESVPNKITTFSVYLPIS